MRTNPSCEPPIQQGAGPGARRRHWKMGVLAIMLCIGWLLFSSRQNAGPTHGGKTLDQWLESSFAYVEGKGLISSVTPEFREALQAMGANAIPQLLERLNRGDYFFYQAIVQRVGNVQDRTLNRLGINSPWINRQRAANGFLALGELATNAIPQIVSGKPTGEMVEALAGIGAAGLPHLLRVLQTGAEQQKVSALFGLQARVYDREIAARQWLEHVTNASPRVRWAATTLLWAAPLKLKSEALSALDTACNDPDPKVAAMAGMTRSRLQARTTEFENVLMP